MKSRAPKRVLFASNWWQQQLMEGVSRHASEHHWHLDLQMLVTGLVPKHWTGDGIITSMPGGTGALLELLTSGNCPAVSLSLNHPEIEIPRVGIDNDVAGQIAVARHALAWG
ncbi:MAG: hypothetical protein HN919_17650 [Verrucomicrobia bacterium]|nr:hypothetical protein [Verrucomicrobiota bacterium]MBT7068125.1 hypothetical protein [Verrucomicrobiota bacterium]MBT7702187.1 hypothetical protein [Verrucomicrobiota bacterium]